METQKTTSPTETRRKLDHRSIQANNEREYFGVFAFLFSSLNNDHFRVWLRLERDISKFGHIVRSYKDITNNFKIDGQLYYSVSTIRRIIKNLCDAGVINKSQLPSKYRVLTGKYPLNTRGYSIDYDFLAIKGISKDIIEQYQRADCRVVKFPNQEKTEQTSIIRKIEYKNIIVATKKVNTEFSMKSYRKKEIRQDFLEMALERNVPPLQAKTSFSRMFDYYERRGMSILDVKKAWRDWLKLEFVTPESLYKSRQLRANLENLAARSVVPEMISKIKHPVYRSVCKSMYSRRGDDWFLVTLAQTKYDRMEGRKIYLQTNSHVTLDKILISARSIEESFRDILRDQNCKVIFEVKKDIIFDVIKLVRPRIEDCHIEEHQVVVKQEASEDTREPIKILRGMCSINSMVERLTLPSKETIDAIDAELNRKIKFVPSKTDLKIRRYGSLNTYG